ncbi:unnamed protein product [Ilex paraguariensis]|uniref:Glycine-rich protein n=1 Tax=Ilex paraguariensis TaxID=185542 RepID=A0ABC8V0P4_9AQUA
MKKNLLAWLFIILSVQVLSSLAFEDPVMFRRDLHACAGVNSTMISSQGDGNDRENMVTHEIVYSIKGVRGRGSNGGGGGNVIHHPRPSERSAVFVLNKPSIFITTSTVCASFGLLLSIPF